MAWGDGAKKIATELAKLHKEFITTQVLFKELKDNTYNSIAEFKVIVEKTIDKIEGIEKEHIQERAELKAEIASLSKRLDMLSEKALHTVMKDIAEKAVDDPKNNGQKILAHKALESDKANNSKSNE